ncbi:hypothetical protein [Sphingopyxis sp.]|jgi:hypothetical protein|uniref:hypothetical protein n=1 Tax=Sphingopyxis sp. TaxID=1908224 RepID=UPI003F6FCDE0
MSLPSLTCPECGSSEGLYVRADLRWMPEEGAFKLLPDIEEPIDCTACDHRWWWTDTGIDPLVSAGIKPA